MKVQETSLENGGYEQRYDLKMMGRRLGDIVRRPVSIQPKEGEAVFVDNGPRYGIIPRRAVAVFRDGKFKSVKFEPTHWSVLEHDND